MTQASEKRIILCADGTWLASDRGDNSIPSNVAKLARAIAVSGRNGTNGIVKQIVSYYGGTGSGDLPFQKALYGGLGWGVEDDVCQIYDFISNNYATGDEIFLFGFSRGAFTVRSVAGLVSDAGVLTARQMSQFPKLWDAYRAHTDGTPFKDSKWYGEHKDELGLRGDVNIKVIGVWDTVGALGIPEWPVVGWFRDRGVSLNKKYNFHNTELSKNIEHAFQALAIDERRLPFTPAVWCQQKGSATKLEQCWFPGIHGNIGGTEKGEIGINTFAWMVDNLSGMLTFEEQAIEDLITEHKKLLKIRSWGCGPIPDNFEGFSGMFYKFLGEEHRTPGNYLKNTKTGTSDNLVANETFHPMIRIRHKALQYTPESLSGFELEEGLGVYKWKMEHEPMPEYVIKEGDKKMSVAKPPGMLPAEYPQDSMSCRLLENIENVVRK